MMKIHARKHIENNLHSLEAGKTIDLSQETLTISDYQWLAEVIKKSIFLETIRLPEIPKGNTEIILSLLNEATNKNSTLAKIDIHISQNNMSKNAAFLYQQIQSRLNRNKRKIFGIHGGGNIGLGLMADVISKSQLGYHILATSNNQLTCSLINSIKKLWLQHGSFDQHEITCVNGIEMISRESQDIIRLYTESCIAALCVTPAVMPEIAKDIAHALIKRQEIDGSGLKILVLMNLPDCAQFVREKIANEILALTKNESLSNKILSCVDFIPTVIDRIVTPIPEDVIKHQLKTQLEKIGTRELSHRIGIDSIDDILSTQEKLLKTISLFRLQFNLFNAEKNFSMHVSDHFNEADRFPLMISTRNLSTLEAVKNKYINGPHAILAWLGALLGFSTISESIKHPIIFTFIKEMMEQEIAPILSIEYPEISKKEFEMLESTFLKRCEASIADPVTRVGRDPMRKLDRGGRVRGTIEIAQKHHLNIPTSRLEEGIAAGILYAIQGVDPANPGCQKIMELYKNNGNSFFAVLCYSGEAPSGSFSGFHRYKDKELITRIIYKMNDFQQWDNQKQDAESLSKITSEKINAVKYNTSIPKIVFTAADYFLSHFLFKIKNAKKPPQNYQHHFSIWHNTIKKNNNEYETKNSSVMNTSILLKK